MPLAAAQGPAVTGDTLALLVSAVSVLVRVVWLGVMWPVIATATWRYLRRLPREAVLAYVETTFRSGTPPLIVARPDRIYSLPSGELILVELKTRRHPTVLQEDIIQISAQRVAVSEATGRVVLRDAFIVFRRDDSRPSRWPVRGLRLMPSDDVRSLTTRRLSLLDGRTLARGPANRGFCRNCAFAHDCQAKLMK
jgi:hypothetical protein